MPIVQTVDLCKDYIMGKENVVRALNGVNLSIERGEFLSIMGPSGSGKSTLLHMLGCLDTPTSGQVIIDNDDIAKVSKDKLPEIRNKKIGFVFQQHHLIPTLSALENVMLPLRYARIPKNDARNRAQELLDRVGLADRMNHNPMEMSGGQQQRVAIARSLVTKPALVLADEPTGALDTKTGDQVIELMLSINKSMNVTFAVVTHNPEVAAATHRVITLRDGKITRDESKPVAVGE